MPKRALLATLGLLAACAARPPPPAPRPVFTSPGPTLEHPQPAPAEPVLDTVPPPPAVDYLTHAEIVHAGTAAVGRLARMRVRRDHYTSSTQFTAVPCGDSGVMWLRYTPEQRDWVRAMHGTPDDACATVTFRVLQATRDPIGFVEGKIEQIETLTPKPPATAPPGADFASLDDAIIAGDDAKGKLVVADVWAYDGNPKELWVNDCNRSDSFVFVIPKTKAALALARRLSTDPGSCGPAHLRIVDPGFVLGGGDGSMQRPRAEVVSVP